jgi:cell fate regulator YaaT (PSP1 superfamily)
MERSYLIRYGLMAQVGRFVTDGGAAYERGQTVVIRSHRGTELGEVLIESPAGAPTESEPAEGLARVLRTAGPDDLERARRAENDRTDRFEACQRVLRDGAWPLELIDVEPLLDDRRTVLHYLGPHRLDAAGLLAVFRKSSDLDVMFEPVGRDLPDDESAEPEHAHTHACGSCGSGGGGCGSGGRCGTSSACSDCGVKKLLAARR